MRFKYYVCQRDIICIAHGDMHRVKFYVKKPKQCDDAYCDIKTIVEVIVSIANPISDGKNKGTRKNVGSDRKKRKVASKKLSRLSRNSSIKR